MSSVHPDERVTVPMLRQRWRDVVFAHWPVPAATIDELLPAGLHADTRDGAAWLTLTPFRVEASRPLFAPPVPGVSNFSETNVRTYVVGPDGLDGLWFFTLETNSLSTTIAANAALRIPYRWATAQAVRTPQRLTYHRRRRLTEPAPEQHLSIEIGRPKPPTNVDLATWLTGRWRAWTLIGRRLTFVPVEHEPWPLFDAVLVDQTGTLVTSLGLPELPGDPLLHWSLGVDARLGWPHLVERQHRRVWRHRPGVRVQHR